MEGKLVTRIAESKEPEVSPSTQPLESQRIMDVDNMIDNLATKLGKLSGIPDKTTIDYLRELNSTLAALKELTKTLALIQEEVHLLKPYVDTQQNTNFTQQERVFAANHLVILEGKLKNARTILGLVGEQHGANVANIPVQQNHPHAEFIKGAEQELNNITIKFRLFLDNISQWCKNIKARLQQKPIVSSAAITGHSHLPSKAQNRAITPPPSPSAP